MPDEQPRCGVVIRKDEQGEELCTLPAADLTSIVNPDEPSQVTAVVLSCKQHSEELEKGKLLMFKSESGDYIAVQFQLQESSNVT